jgi:hypothetical protein
LESGKGVLQVGGWLRDTGWSRLVGVDTTSSEWDIGAPASHGRNNGTQSDEISSSGALVVETAEETEGVVPSIARVLGAVGLPEDGSVQTSGASLSIVCNSVVESRSNPFGRVLSSWLAVSEGTSYQSYSLLAHKIQCNHNFW